MPEWTRVITAGANVLLEGDRRNTDAAILHLLPHLPAPIFYSGAGEELSLLNHCTVILRDVDTLPDVEQKRLHDWLGRKPDSVQTVSTTQRSLFALVQDGRFEPDLYYRLNVILLRLNVDDIEEIGGVDAVDAGPRQ
ncbi:MAG TPA: sigma 54-interacting transcriptional regulator [Vicinamibacterales bacterium]|nr:sigma 54-interacting transcriptional regulator [Vicinamibacterales bacterium]